jgi:hypothetical protein
MVMAIVLLMASLGQVATSIGAGQGGHHANTNDLWHGYKLMIAGRVAFALGSMLHRLAPTHSLCLYFVDSIIVDNNQIAEALATSCPHLLYHWFEKHQLRTATGILLVVSRLGPVINVCNNTTLITFPSQLTLI